MGLRRSSARRGSAYRRPGSRSPRRPHPSQRPTPSKRWTRSRRGPSGPEPTGPGTPGLRRRTVRRSPAPGRLPASACGTARGVHACTRRVPRPAPRPAHPRAAPADGPRPRRCRPERTVRRGRNRAGCPRHRGRRAGRRGRRGSLRWGPLRRRGCWTCLESPVHDRNATPASRPRSVVGARQTAAGSETCSARARLARMRAAAWHEPLLLVRPARGVSRGGLTAVCAARLGGSGTVRVWTDLHCPPVCHSEPAWTLTARTPTRSLSGARPTAAVRTRWST